MKRVHPCRGWRIAEMRVTLRLSMYWKGTGFRRAGAPKDVLMRCSVNGHLYLLTNIDLSLSVSFSAPKHRPELKANRTRTRDFPQHSAERFHETQKQELNFFCYAL